MVLPVKVVVLPLKVVVLPFELVVLPLEVVVLPFATSDLCKWLKALGLQAELNVFCVADHMRVEQTSGSNCM